MKLEGVRAILDTSTLPDFGKAACEDDGVIVAWHVTDEPQKIVAMLRKRTNFLKAYGSKGQTSELGPGFYVSCIPDFWASRSTKKWAFLKTLGEIQKAKILQALKDEVALQAARARLSKTEVGFAERLFKQSEAENDLDTLVMLASQPYGIAWHRDSWLSAVGVRNEPPSAVKVIVRGSFAELGASRPSASTLRAVRKQGLDGVFTKGSMSSNAEMCVFHGRSLRFVAIESV